MFSSFLETEAWTMNVQNFVPRSRFDVKVLQRPSQRISKVLVSPQGPGISVTTFTRQRSQPWLQARGRNSDRESLRVQVTWKGKADCLLDLAKVSQIMLKVQLVAIIGLEWRLSLSTKSAQSNNSVRKASLLGETARQNALPGIPAHDPSYRLRYSTDGGRKTLLFR